MGMTGQGMWDVVKAKQDAISPIQSTDSGDALAYADAMKLAEYEGIVEYIQANAVVTTTSGAPNEEHTGEID